MVQLSYEFRSETFYPLQIKSDYHLASYTAKNLDTWMFTNSTEVTLSYEYDRLGQLSTNKKL